MCRSTFSLCFFVRPSCGLGDLRFDFVADVSSAWRGCLSTGESYGADWRAGGRSWFSDGEIQSFDPAVWLDRRWCAGRQQPRLTARKWHVSRMGGGGGSRYKILYTSFVYWRHVCNQVRAHTGPPTDVWINSHNKIRTYIPDAKRVAYAPKHCQIKNNNHVFIQQHKIFEVISPFYIAENRTTHTQGILFLAHDNHHCLSHVTKTWPQSDHMTQ